MNSKGNELTFILNLITDMTIKGATVEELERAVDYSMAVINVEKKGKINGITILHEKYGTKEAKNE